jgi:hypothetical protein
MGWVSGGLTRAVILVTKDGGGVTPGTGISEEDSPYRDQLEQNYPNPFSTSTQISYALKNSSHNTLTVYDISGRKVQTLVDEFQAAGEHSIHWDASHFSSGLYFYELKVDHVSVRVKKMMRE